jgi:hypothetical protein
VAEYSNAICLLIRIALRPAIRAPARSSMALAISDILIKKVCKCWGQTVAEQIDQPLAQGSCANYQ